MKEKKYKEEVMTWKQAKEKLPDANLAVISIPGYYVAKEAERALDEGLHVFLFSGNVALDDEVRLKKKAHEKGLLVMGPDCGTEIIQGIPIAFANHVSPGKIGIVGAAGTGIQELTTIIDRLGEGVTNAIGTGGRDLSEKVGGITMMDVLNVMETDPQIEVVIVISKPPARTVRDKMITRLSSYAKPVITVFLGERPEVHTEGFYHAYTLDEAARMAVRLVRGEKAVMVDTFQPKIKQPYGKEEGKTIKAYYSGGSLANEAAMMIRDRMGLPVSLGRKEGFVLNCEGNMVIDLGNDVYTKGGLHPKIDPSQRIECMEKAADDKTTGVVLFDIVTGCGAHPDMAGALLPVIQSLKEKAKESSKKLFFITTVCGTQMDPQNYNYQKKKLERAGVIVCESNKQAVETALFCIGYPYHEEEKELIQIQKRKGCSPPVLKKVKELLENKPKVINIGFKFFADGMERIGCEVEQIDWIPPSEDDLVVKKAKAFFEKNKFN